VGQVISQKIVKEHQKQVVKVASRAGGTSKMRPDVLEKIVGTIPVKRLGEPSEIASIIAWLASEEGGYSTGADFSVNGGLHMH
jgi:NAD(P)-dependent dehydrogenase (short-subunit alcohol dehydrogenase family)